MSVRKRGLLLGAALTLAVTATTAAEDENSANYLMPVCRQYDGTASRVIDAFVAGRCIGIIQGIVYRDATVCPPEEARIRQLLRVVVLYIDARPARWHEPYIKLAYEALRAAWPCK
jgi:Rap1a immunity proteins